MLNGQPKLSLSRGIIISCNTRSLGGEKSIVEILGVSSWFTWNLVTRRESTQGLKNSLPYDHNLHHFLARFLHLSFHINKFSIYGNYSFCLRVNILGRFLESIVLLSVIFSILSFFGNFVSTFLAYFVPDRIKVS